MAPTWKAAIACRGSANGGRRLQVQMRRRSSRSPPFPCRRRGMRMPPVIATLQVARAVRRRRLFRAAVADPLPPAPPLVGAPFSAPPGRAGAFSVRRNRNARSEISLRDIHFGAGGAGVAESAIRLCKAVVAGRAAPTSGAAAAPHRLACCRRLRPTSRSSASFGCCECDLRRLRYRSALDSFPGWRRRARRRQQLRAVSISAREAVGASCRCGGC